MQTYIGIHILSIPFMNQLIDLAKAFNWKTDWNNFPILFEINIPYVTPMAHS